jgi:hypothetical protein
MSETPHIIDLAEYGPSAIEFQRLMAKRRWRANGCQLARSRDVPDIDAQCRRYFACRDFVECGETQAFIRIANRPKESDTYTALHDLAVNVLARD